MSRPSLIPGWVAIESFLATGLPAPDRAHVGGVSSSSGVDGSALGTSGVA
eukprot:CAMPEP_0204353912 /NCGR_PEP_ID=MMETSP0469-20131031/33012_1 /ASSEMBLY_ACC=CAM_ASM_000384 /TAXON_ID=2969 /ORGANISM="Oxyrrhis marina" /LENGTH=49 /DNA_ID= /DNA_START= /DNA_END= /DNA_ORIENTATION=